MLIIAENLRIDISNSTPKYQASNGFHRQKLLKIKFLVHNRREMYPTLKNGRSHYDILAALNPGRSITLDMHCKPVKYQINLQCK